ncbi:hypothetical protein HPULCUR_000546 [Helicostylum pulchrum]|uniref:ZSWIM1/3 RNaseH-like domain-containing protein n=1 Tax=Helicostylum pulchrum TaxID=562976 RepID=A0ABP9XK71_9FUNG
MPDFVKNLKLGSYEVRYLEDENKRICCIFFAHKHGVEEARKLPECVIVDATYKTNSHNMVLLNFMVAGTLRAKERPKQLGTGCRMDHETAGPGAVQPSKLIVYNTMKRTFAGKQGYDVYSGFHGAISSPLVSRWAPIPTRPPSKPTIFLGCVQGSHEDQVQNSISPPGEGRYKASEVTVGYFAVAFNEKAA